MPVRLRHPFQLNDDVIRQFRCRTCQSDQVLGVEGAADPQLQRSDLDRIGRSRPASSGFVAQQ